MASRSSRSRAISKLLGSDNKIQETSFSESVSLGTESIPTVNDLPLSGNQVGDFAFVEESNRLYIWSGSGWYSVALINTSPAFDSGGSPEATYDLDSIGGTATTITLSATDPEGVPIQYSAIPSDSANDLATITQSDNTFIVTARSLDSIIANGYDSSGGTFNVTFRASDGVNLATALSEFTLAFAAPYSFQGSNFGYTSGGYTAPTTTTLNTVDKFPFSADANATNVGDLTESRLAAAGQSSNTHGYTSGGSNPTLSPALLKGNVIDKFPFSADANATDVGDLTEAKNTLAGQSSTVSGYTSGGQIPASSNVIEKFPFSSDASASDVGDLTEARANVVGQNSTTHGYSAGGSIPAGSKNTIDKFPFSTDANATDVGDLTEARFRGAGQSSTTHGYTSGGLIFPPVSNIIDKFPFASDANATDVGDLVGVRDGPAGQSSTDNGYTSGGSVTNTIQKFPFASDANALDVGDLTETKEYLAGQQY